MNDHVPPPLPEGYEEERAPPLTWRAWLLVPLVAVGLVGVVVAITDPASEPDRDPFDIPRRQQEKRVPYDDELQELMINTEGLTRLQIMKYGDLHDRCKRYKHGRIPVSLRKQVDEILERHR